MNCFDVFYDISVGLSEKLPMWPGSYGFRHQQIQEIDDQHDAAVSALHYDVHVGTHIDAPAHFVKGGKLVQDIPLDVFLGSCYVVDCSGLSVIIAEDLISRNIPNGVTRLLLKTDNSSDHWFTKPFNENFVAISNDCAQYLVDKGIRLIGIDGPSIQKYHDSKDTHITLLSNEVIILEGIFLDAVSEGKYQLYCPPVKVLGSEAMSVRAILFE